MRGETEKNQNAATENYALNDSPFVTKPNDSFVGRLLDNRFLIEKNLTAPDIGADEGGIGVVYLARDTKLLDKKVVIKILRQSVVEQTPDLLRKFSHEKEALARLEHPNIVSVLDSGTLADGSPFLVMQYIAGYSLRRVLKENKKVSNKYCAEILEAITDALGAAHAEGILHRDIKPENVMITPREDGTKHIRLIDFGIARVLNSQIAPETDVECCKGTILYIAPEQLRGEIRQTAAGDVYSCAVMAYEMLTGEYPFKPQSIYEMLQLQIEGVKITPSSLVGTIPPAAERLILQALSYEPERRPQNIRQFGRDLAGALRISPSKGDKFITSDSASASSADEEIIEPTMKLPPQIDQQFSSNPARPPSAVKTLEMLDGATQKPVSMNLATSPLDVSQSDSYTTTPELAPRRLKFKRVFPVLTALLLMIFGTAAGLFWWNRPPLNASPAETMPAGAPAEIAAPQHRLAYRLEIQKVSGDSLVGKPFPVSEKQIFDSKNNKYKLFLTAYAPGFLYVFNEAENRRGETYFSILFPTPKIQNGSPQVAADKTVETGLNYFKAGEKDKAWIVWTASSEPILEAARASAFSNGGIVKDSGPAEQLQSFLRKNDNSFDVKKINGERVNELGWAGERLAYAIRLEHR